MQKRSAVKTKMNDWNAEAVRQTLEDAGCADDMVTEVLARLPKLSPDELLRLLNEHRRSLLDDMHSSQKKLECLDYLRYQIINAK